MNYSVLPPESLEVVYKQVSKYLPDALRSPQAFAMLYSSSDSMFFEVGILQGAFWLAGIRVGWKAAIHVVLWDPEARQECLKKVTVPKRAVRDVFRLLRLQRLEAYIPVRKRTGCQYAEAVGFRMEGILRKYDKYDGDLVDVAVYSILQEDL